MKRLMFLFVAGMMLALTPVLKAEPVKYIVDIVDLAGSPYLSASSVTIYRPGTSTAATIWTTESMGTAVTNPIVTGLTDGSFEFYGDYPYYDIKIVSSVHSAVVMKSSFYPTNRRIIYPGADFGLYKTVEIADACDTILSAESGKTFICTGLTGYGSPTNQIMTLPPCSAGLWFTFVDANATANADLIVQCYTSDTINGGTASKAYTCTGDAVKQAVTIVGQNDTAWLVLSENGTWVNAN